ncbi:AHH domain-containing protein [Ruminococcus flavefaciens]|uniref:AHH domain-containing protein n=1 Tax=Ruminococcus flavefaciens TaxID=1265 RepID=UPI00325C0406
MDPSGYSTLAQQLVTVAGVAVIAGALYAIDYYAINVYKKLKISTFGNMEYYFPKAVLTGATIEGLNKIALIVATNVSKLYSEIIVNDVLESVLVGEYEVSYLFSPIHSYISNKIEKLQNDKKSNKRNLHHIVARTSMKAALARSILFKVGIPINSTENLVSIKEFVHWYMHTDVYYAWVNWKLSLRIQSLKDLQSQ